MKCQILFSRKNKKTISKCCLLNFHSVCKVLHIVIALVQGRGNNQFNKGRQFNYSFIMCSYFHSFERILITVFIDFIELKSFVRSL